MVEVPAGLGFGACVVGGAAGWVVGGWVVAGEAGFAGVTGACIKVNNRTATINLIVMAAAVRTTQRKRLSEIEGWALLFLMRPLPVSARRCALVLALSVLLSGCHDSKPAAAAAAAAAPAPPRIVLNAESPRPTIDVIGVPVEALNVLPESAADDAWRRIIIVSSGNDSRPLLGQYAIVDGVVRFTPMFPLDRGRPYLVTFAPPGGRPITTTVSFPTADLTSTTSVIQSYPTASLVPANLLKMHMVFSAPMATRDITGVIHLLDSSGADKTDLLLPLDADSWNLDRTHCTLILDPAKRALLVEGEIYTLSVSASWRDAHGLPLKQPFRRAFTLGPVDEAPIDPTAWKIELPAAGSTGPLVIIFTAPLDYESLLDAILVTGPDKKPIEGRVVVGAGESTWTFAPDEAWQAGPHVITVSKSLSDLAGNTIGDVFDAEAYDRTNPAVVTEKTLLPVTIR